MIAALALAAAATAAAPEPAPAEQTAEVVEKLNQQVADATFLDERANRVALRDVVSRGKPVVLTLIYFDCPMLCSLVQKGVIKALNETGLKLGQDYEGLTVSFSTRDRPPQALLRQGGYLQTLQNAEHASPADWPFLTGGEPSIHALADSVGFRYRWDAESQQFDHPAVSMVLSPDGRIMRYLYGVEIPARDMKLAILEAGKGRVGTALDRVVLRCFKYDPSSRRYHVYILGIVRTLSGAVAVGLFGMVAVLFRRERKGKRA